MPRDSSHSEPGPNTWECISCGAINSTSDRSCRTCGAPAIVPLGPILTLDADELLARFGPSGERLMGKRYRLTRAIGGGSTGSVFKAIDTNLDRVVAIKVLSTTSADGMDVSTRFLRLRTEGQVLGRLRHPGLVTVFDMGNEDGVLYIVMEFVKGRPLKSFLIPQRSLPTEDAVSIMIQVSDALHHAHRHGVVHRDLKPSNIMLLEDDRVKVTDFGLAKVAFGGKVAEAGLAIGTPYYMSPEQLRAQDVDHRSDIFSAGIVLYEMLTGQKPFEGDNLSEIVRAILSGQFTRPRQLNGSLPAEIEAAIEKALANNRGMRYFSIAEFGDDLRAWQSRQSFSLTQEVELSFKEPVARHKGPYGQRKSRRGEAAFILAVVALVVSATFTLIHVNSDKYALKKAADSMLEDYAMQRFDRVYQRLSDDFKGRYSLKDFMDLPYLGFLKARSPGAMLCSVDKIIFLKRGIVGNVIVSVRYSDAITAERYTMRWVKEGGEWRYRNPEYEGYTKMFPRSGE